MASIPNGIFIDLDFQYLKRNTHSPVMLNL